MVPKAVILAYKVSVQMDGTYQVMMSNLNVKYYVRAFATNSQGTSYGNQVDYTNITGQTGTLYDIDGNNYDWIAIGSQI